MISRGIEANQFARIPLIIEVKFGTDPSIFTFKTSKLTRYKHWQFPAVTLLRGHRSNHPEVFYKKGFEKFR